MHNSWSRRCDVFGRIDYTEGAAWRTHCPRGEHESGDDERSDDVKAVRTIAAAHAVGGSCAGEVEEDAGVGPFFEAGEAGYENGERSEEFPEAEDGKEVHGVAKD